MRKRLARLLLWIADRIDPQPTVDDVTYLPPGATIRGRIEITEDRSHIDGSALPDGTYYNMSKEDIEFWNRARRHSPPLA